MKTRDLILQYVNINKTAGPDDLAKHLRLSRVSIHRRLRKMVAAGELVKFGKAPRVFYKSVNPKDDINRMISRIRPVLLNHRISRAELFGSRARAQAEPQSDIDILVAMPKTASLLDLGKLYYDLNQAVGGDVDLVEYESVHPYISQNVFSKTIRVI